MNTIEGIYDVRSALQEYVAEEVLPLQLRSRLNAVVVRPVPPEWAVYGMEALWASYDELSDRGKLLCAQCAEFIQRPGHGFYAQGKLPPEGNGRGYAIWQFYLNEVGDANADPTVDRPSVDVTGLPSA